MAFRWKFSKEQLESWSRRPNAPARLPALVRRLLLATTRLHSIDMRADEGVAFPGPDGRVRSSEPTPFCPSGFSLWELSVQERKSKFDDDYEKRTQQPPENIEPGTTTYVAVSARALGFKGEWQDEKTAQHVWADVRLLDVDDLLTWLEQAPAVACWWAEELGLPAYDVTYLDAFLRGWEKRTSPELPRSLLLAGEVRKRQAEHVREWALSSVNEPLRIVASSADEAVAFAAAALRLHEGNQDFWNAHTLVVESAEALRWAQQQGVDKQLFVLPHFDGFHAGLVHPTAAKVRVVIPMDDSNQIGPNDVRLENPGHRSVAESLVRHGGFSVEKAERLAQDAGGNLSALQRLCGYTPKPPWLSLVDNDLLTAMVLVGGWNPEREGDREAVRLLGIDLERFAESWNELATVPSSPVVFDPDRWGRGGWSWKAPGDVWATMATRFSTPMLEHFAQTARSVLGRDDPRYELAPDKRMMAPVLTKVLPESGLLRHGFAESLPRLACCEHVAPHRDTLLGSKLAERVVGQVLAPPWLRWASLSNLLPLLAEAAPETFLKQLKQSLEAGSEGVAHLFEEESVFGASSPHTGLLWALETLGWHDRHLPAVTAALASLAEADQRLPERTGRLANRPLRSLASLLSFSYAQTKAPRELREKVARKLTREHPRLVLKLALDQFPSSGGRLFLPTPRPKIRSWALPTDEELFARADRDAADGVPTAVSLALDLVGTDADSWGKLLEASHGLPDAEAARVVAVLAERKEQIDDAEHLVWSALREWLHEENWRSPASGSLSEKRREVYQLFAPRDLVARVAWLFGTHVSLPEFTGDPRGKDSMQQTEKRKEHLRQQALQELWVHPDRSILLTRLAQAVGQASPGWNTIGRTLAQTPFADEATKLLLDANADPNVKALLASFVFTRAQTAPTPWVESLLRRLADENRHEEATTIAVRLSATPSMWSMLERIGEPLHTAYWRNLSGYLSLTASDEWEHAVSNMLAAGNIQHAFVAASYGCACLPTATLVDVLERPHMGSEQQTSEHDISYRVGLLFSELDRRLDVDANQMVELEKKYFDVLLKSPRKLRNLERHFREHPEKFATFLLQADSCSSVREIIRSWRGCTCPSHEREDLALTWARKVMEVMRSEGNEGRGAYAVAEVLARMPSGDDGHWPCLAARHLIEQECTIGTFTNKLSVAKQNLRGVFSKDPIEGGQQERSFAAEYRASAKGLRVEWSRTSALLDEMADHCEEDAANEDHNARRTARHWGQERDEAVATLRQLRDYDIVVALWLTKRPEWATRLPELAHVLGFPEQEADRVPARLTVSKLFNPESQLVDANGLVSILRAGLQKAFPAENQQAPENVRGVRTGLEATPFREQLLTDAHVLRVWKTADGDAKGQELSPLCPNAPALAHSDREMYEILALVDTLRFGRARERSVALDALRQRLHPQPISTVGAA